MEDFYDFVKTLPAALDPETQENLFREFQQTQNQEIRDKLIIGNLRLVAHIVKKNFYYYHIPMDELYSCGLVCLARGVDTFDPNLGTKPSTYLTQVIVRGIVNEYQKTSQRLGDLIELDRSVNAADEEESPLIDFIADPDDDFVSTFMKEDEIAYNMDKVNEALRCVPVRNKEILLKYYGITFYGKRPTYEEIGDQYGISRERTRQIILRTTTYIKKKLGIIKVRRLREPRLPKPPINIEGASPSLPTQPVNDDDAEEKE